MKILYRNVTLICLYVLFAITIFGCVQKLAPDYDKALVDGLTTSNVELMKFLASVSGGTSNDTFSEREEKYNNLIGTMDALELLSKSRPIPNNKVVEKVNKTLESRNLPKINDNSAPSAYALSKISDSLGKMKNTDKKQGITPLEVQAFKNEISIFMDQAITYERALER